MENQDEFENNKIKYIGKSIYYDIILTENLKENCNNAKCSLCYEKNDECLTFKSDTETEIINPYKKNIDLELLYSTIIIIGICIIPYFLFASFQNLRIIFFIFQFIIFCIITFNSKYKNHYLWENINYEPKIQLLFPVITDIKPIFYSSINLYDLKITTSYQNFSVIKTDEYSKECLLNYFIKITEICPITHIIINNKNNRKDKYNFTDYSVLNNGNYTAL